jgi:hypothetical protein
MIGFGREVAVAGGRSLRRASGVPAGGTPGPGPIWSLRAGVTKMLVKG